MELIQQVFVEEEWSSILGIPLSRSWPDDHQYWWPTSDGVFSVRSCYWLGRLGHLRTWRLQHGVGVTKVWHNVWRLGGPPKLSHFIWRACKGSLAVKESLFRRHIGDSAGCSVCDAPSESIYHAIFECNFAKVIWQVSPFVTLLANAPTASFAELFEWLVEKLSGEELRIFCSLAWAAWYCRNKFIFEQQSVDASVMACHFVKLTHDFGLYAKKVFLESSRVCTTAAKWHYPPVGWMKANFDAHIGPNGDIGLGVVVRDSSGRMVLGGVRRRTANWDVHISEAMAGLFVVELLRRFGFSRVVVEGDSLVVLSALKNKPVGGSPIFNIFNDISRVCLSFDEVSFSHVRRAGNVVAHLLARWECVANSEVVWLDSFPQSVSTLVDLDLI